MITSMRASWSAELLEPLLHGSLVPWELVVGGLQSKRVLLRALRALRIRLADRRRVLSQGTERFIFGALHV